VKVTTVTFEGTPEEYREYLDAISTVTNTTNRSDNTNGTPLVVELRDFIQRALNRMQLPDRQIELFRTLYAVDGQQLSKNELEARMGTTSHELSGVLGALGRRIRGTSGSEQVAQQIGATSSIETFLKISRINGKWYYSLRPELRELLESENIILNTSVPLSDRPMEQ
jgi:hypothetical protein